MADVICNTCGETANAKPGEPCGRDLSEELGHDQTNPSGQPIICRGLYLKAQTYRIKAPAHYYFNVTAQTEAHARQLGRDHMRRATGLPQASRYGGAFWVDDTPNADENIEVSESDEYPNRLGHQ